MATDKIPVTFDFFKKYTYYEEWTEFILRRKCNGNQPMYEVLASNEDTKELALRKYYEAFYLKPKIRDKYHIRIKPVPKRIKDKLLSIPVLDTSMVNKAVSGFEENEVKQALNVLSGFDNSSSNDPALEDDDAKSKISKRSTLPVSDVCEEDQFVIDDDEPSCSDEETNLKNANKQLNSSAEKQTNEEPVPSSSKVSNSTEIQNRSPMENDKDEHPKSSNNSVQQKNPKISSASPLTSAIKTSNLNYKDLKQYMHCCPLTLDEFCKYSNINELIKVLSAPQKPDAVKRHIIRERFYVLFYLVPEYRKIVPFSKIRLLDNCPPQIKEKFFSIPTRLYLKEQNITNIPNDVKQTTSSATNPHQKEAVVAVDQQFNNNSNEKLNNSTQPASKTSENIVLNNSRVQINNATSRTIISTNTAQITVPSKNCHEKSTNCTQQKIISPPTIPVSLDEFKKFTHFEGIVEKLFKIKAQNNEDLFLKYKSSPEAFVNTLENYYRAFYLYPVIREICPIRMKPTPNFLKNRLLQIPEGVNITSCNNFKLEQLVSPDLNVAALSEKESNVGNSPLEKSVSELTKDKDASSSGVETNLKNANEQLNSSAEKQTNEEPVPSSSKVSNSTEIQNRSSMENYKDEYPKSSNSVQQKNPKISSASPPTSTIKTSNLNYKDLKQYMHCCPLTLDEFCKYSNINELIKVLSAPQKPDAVKRHIIRERFYVLFYLVPEYRKIVPFSKIRLLDNCPPQIKEKFFSIPTRLYLKEQNITNIPNDVKQTTSSATNPHQKEAVVAVDQQFNNNSNEKLNNSTQPASKTSENIVLNNSRVQINNATSRTIISTNTAQTTVLSKNCHEKSMNCTQQKIISPPTIPVSLDEFKKFTHFEEVVKKLFKIKAQNNEDLFLKYKSCPEAIVNTLENYYRAFYLSPAIREICPIRMKPVPNSLKNRLLQIPEGVNVTSGDNFKVEQLVSPELNVAALSEKESIVGNSPMQKSVTELREDKDSANKSNNGLTSLPKPIVTNMKIENDTEKSDSKSNTPLDGIKKTSNRNESTSPLGGIKRAIDESNESPSSKRQKVQQTTRNSSNNTHKTKKTYKDLLPYAHCCPVSRSDFCKYTNISELFRGFCQKRYNSLQKLPFMLKRAYILFYLAPKNRSFKPFNKLKILDECPKNLRDKIFEIPTNLYLKEDKINDLQNQETQAQKITTEQQEGMNTSDRCIKEPIKILENILLQPASRPSCPAGHSNKKPQCSNPTCIFHHITYLDFMEESNILTILPKPHDVSSVQKMFKEIIYKIIKQQECDKKYSINGSLLSKLLSHQKICEECENEVVSPLSSETTTAHSKSQNERVLNEANKTVIEGSPVNNERTLSTTKAAAVDGEASHDTVTDNSTNKSQTECSGNTKHIQQEMTKPPIDLCKYLRNDKIFSLFCQKMLEKLKKSVNETVDFSSETYEIFLRCNEIPLREILNEFSNNNEEIVQRILNNTELCDALQCFYFCRYLTNSSLALKYPLKMKQQTDVQENCNVTKENNANTSNKNEHGTNNSLVRREMNLNSSNAARITSSRTTRAQKENSFNATLNPKNVLNQNNALEKAKRIFFRNVEKTNTLPYVLRTTFGLKQLILRTVLTLTFKEFVENTNVYEGKELYADNHVAECMYRYVFHSPAVWPTNLYVTLEFLCKFLQEKNIRFEDYSTMLTHISPKFLHWSVLLACTDIVDCVKNDYEKRTGKMLDTFDTKRLKEECIEYYDRCWKYEKWVSQVPLVYEEFYKDLLNDNNQGDVTMDDVPALQRICKGNVTRLDEPNEQTVCNEPAGTANNIAEAYQELVSNLVSEVEVETFTDNNADRSITEFDCVLLPNTQQQIELLPAEVRVSNDPLNNSSSMCNLNVSSSSEMSCTVVGSLGKPNQAAVKPEPIEKKLLSHLLFYEDDNSDIQCSPYADEIIDLNNTLSVQDVGENLPPSQINFEETTVPHKLSDILLNSDGGSNSLMSLAQHQSPGEGNDAAFVNTQESIQQTQTAEEISTNSLQLRDVSLRSSGENENFENVQEQLPEHDRGRLFPISFEDMLALCGGFSPEQTNTLNQQQKQEFMAETAYASLAAVDEQQVTNQQPIPCVSVQTFKICDQPSTITKAASLPLGRVVTKANATNKSKKDVAKVRPLQKTDLVPQIQHNTRPLQTKPAYSTVGSSTASNKLPPSSEISPSALLKLNLTPTNSNSSSSNEQSTKNASIQFQLSPLGTHIYISQELNKNCSVFDNTTLLRIVDHDYYQQTTTNVMSAAPSQPSNEQVPGISLTIEEQQPAAVSNNTITQQAVRGSTRRNSMHPNDTTSCANQNTNKLSNTTKEQPAPRVTRKSSTIQPDSSTQAQTSISVTKQHVSPRIVTRRSSSLNANTNNDKVNNINLTNTNNIVASLTTPIISHPNHHHHHHSYKMIRKLCLHREIINFHYFKELTRQHISEYLLPSLEIGKSYIEALIVSENFKTRITNRSVSALFSFWPQNFQRDFLMVLNDLKEFHYVVYKRVSMQKQEDLRARILFWLLYTAPAFSFCQLINEESSKEFSHCEVIQNANNPSYERKPFKCLTNALKPHILEKLREMKLNLERD